MTSPLHSRRALSGDLFSFYLLLHLTLTPIYHTERRSESQWSDLKCFETFTNALCIILLEHQLSQPCEVNIRIFLKYFLLAESTARSDLFNPTSQLQRPPIVNKRRQIHHHLIRPSPQLPSAFFPPVNALYDPANTWLGGCERLHPTSFSEIDVVW